MRSNAHLASGKRSRGDVRGKLLRASRRVLPLILALCAAAGAVESTDPLPVVIRVAPVSVVDGERITLGEVAAIENAEPALARYLAGLDLGNAPAPGKRHRLKTSHIRLLVLQQNLGLDDFSVAGPPIVEVRAEGTIIAGDTLVDTVIAYVRASTGWSEDEARIRALRRPYDLYLPPGPVDLEIEQVSGDAYGMTLYVIVAWQDGFEVGRVPISLEIRRSREVVVAMTQLEPGATVSEGDVSLARRTISSEYDEQRYLDDPSAVVGQRVRRRVRESSPIAVNMIETPPVVQRGEPVAIRMERGGISVTTHGVAREPGRVGEEIAVETASGSSLRGELVERGVVVVQ